MESGKLRFEKKTEDRGWYFVEYDPPIEGFPFATADLVIVEPAEKSKIVDAMEAELRTWLARYPVPVMISAFDDKENLINLEPFKECNHLMGFVSEAQKEPVGHWHLVSDANLPHIALDQASLKRIYHDIPFKIWPPTDAKRAEQEQTKMVRTAWIILFVWLVIVPLAIIILGETSVWVARIVLIYSIWKVVVQSLKLTGHWKQSAREKEKQQGDREKEHHHYHCKKNPQGFLRLKIENSQNEARERTQKQVAAFKTTQSK